MNKFIVALIATCAFNQHAIVASIPAQQSVAEIKQLAQASSANLYTQDAPLTPTGKKTVEVMSSPSVHTTPEDRAHKRDHWKKSHDKSKERARELAKQTQG
jgi:hypothetical protein